MSATAAARSLAANDYPCLAAGVRIQRDHITGKSVLLFPNGMVILNTPGLAILNLCDGQHTFTEILDELGAQCSLPNEEMRDDVGCYLHRLHERRLLVLRRKKRQQRKLAQPAF